MAPVQSISPPPTLFVADDGNDTLNRTNTFPFDILFDDYHEYYEVVSELQKFANDYPEIVEFYTLTDLIPAGQTWQGNEIYGVKISDNVANEPEFYDDPDEETMFIVGNHHAREWMTVVTPLYFVYYLTHFYGAEPTDNDGDGLVNEDPIDGIDNDGDGELGGRVDAQGRAMWDGIPHDVELQEWLERGAQVNADVAHGLSPYVAVARIGSYHVAVGAT